MFAIRALFRVRVEGLANLPRASDGSVVGGWICAGVPHRTWIEPALLLALMPARPRLVIVADRRTVAGSWWRMAFARLFGGIVPVGLRQRGGVPFAGHVAAVSDALEAACVVAIFPEVGPPSRPPTLRRLAPGVAHFALHAGAPVVTVVFGGTHELYLFRRIQVRVLPALDPPASGSSRSELARFMEQFQAQAAPAAAESHRAADRARRPRRKRWRWLTGRYPRA